MIYSAQTRTQDGGPFASAVSLRWSRAEISGPTRRVMAGTGWSVLGNGFARGLAVATALAAARLLGREHFGALCLVQLTMATAANLVSLQMGQTATRFVAEYRQRSPESAKVLVRFVTRIALVCGLLAMTILMVNANWAARVILGQTLLGPCVRLAAPGVLLTLYSGVQIGVLCGFEHFRRSAWVNAVGCGAIFGGVVLGSWQAGLRGAIVGWVCGNAILCIAGEYMLRRVSGHHAMPDRRVRVSLRSLLISYSLPLFLASTWLSVVMLRCNALLAKRYSLSEVALYSAADRFHLVLLFVPSALFATMFPILANLRSDPQGYWQVLRTCLVSTLLTLVFPAVLMACFAGTILATTFGAEFRIAGAVLGLLCVAAVFEAINIVAGQVLLIAGWVKLRASTDALLGTLLLVFSMLWIPPFGGRGFAAAYAVSFACAGVLLLAALATIRNAGLVEKPLAPDHSTALLKPELQEADVHLHV